MQGLRRVYFISIYYIFLLKSNIVLKFRVFIDFFCIFAANYARARIQIFLLTLQISCAAYSREIFFELTERKFVRRGKFENYLPTFRRRVQKSAAKEFFAQQNFSNVKRVRVLVSFRSHSRFFLYIQISVETIFRTMCVLLRKGVYLHHHDFHTLSEKKSLFIQKIISSFFTNSSGNVPQKLFRANCFSQIWETR